eukprot:scaffold33006_cov39-Prasinocladus_malaysianus.AAC.1
MSMLRRSLKFTGHCDKHQSSMLQYLILILINGGVDDGLEALKPVDDIDVPDSLDGSQPSNASSPDNKTGPVDVE